MGSELNSYLRVPHRQDPVDIVTMYWRRLEIGWYKEVCSLRETEQWNVCCILRFFQSYKKSVVLRHTDIGICVARVIKTQLVIGYLRRVEHEMMTSERGITLYG